MSSKTTLHLSYGSRQYVQTPDFYASEPPRLHKLIRVRQSASSELLASYKTPFITVWKPGLGRWCQARSWVAVATTGFYDGCSSSWRLTSPEEHYDRTRPTSRVCVCCRLIRGGRVLVGASSPPDAWKVRPERESIPRWKSWSLSSATAACFTLTSAPSVLLNGSSRK